MSMAENNSTPCSRSDAPACNPRASAGIDPDQFKRTSWPRFLVIKSLDGKCITKHNIFVVSKAIEGIAGKSVIVKRWVKSGLLLVEVDCQQYSINLLQTTRLHDIPVEISEHKTLNYSKGVVSSDVLDDLTDQEITDQLNSSGQEVKEVHRIMTYKNKIKTPTKTVIITFDKPTLPEFVYTGFMRLKVRVYVPNPMRCFQCGIFGHTKNNCKKEPACDKCGQPGHEDSDCSNPLHCVNCGEEHPASSRDCPEWKFRKDVLKYKHENNVSYPEAERQISIKLPKSNNNQSYSSAVTQSSVVTKSTVKLSASCQTDLTWPNDFTSPVLHSECVISNEKAVQSVSMDFDYIKTKRVREGSLSSNEEDDMPSLEKPRMKRSHLSVHQTGNIGNVSTSSVPAGEGAVGGETGGARKPRSPSLPRRGRTGRRRKPPDQSVSPASRDGSNQSSKAGIGRKLSPIKLPH